MTSLSPSAKRYLFSIIRCVPDPSTGEFVNVGAVAGDPDGGDWSVRQVSNESRVRKLAAASDIRAVHEVLAKIGEAVDIQLDLANGQFASAPIDGAWLEGLHHDLRNVVQVTRPAPVVATTAEQALDMIFSRMIIDPVEQARGFITKARVTSDLQRAYFGRLAPEFIMARPELHVGDHLHAQLDFAVANGRAVQVAQGWSFQRAGVDEVAEQVKAWGYTISRMRNHDGARVIGPTGRVATVDGDNIDVAVVVASAKTHKQELAFEEANEIFTGVRATVFELGAVDSVSARADELIARARQ